MVDVGCLNRQNAAQDFLGSSLHEYEKASSALERVSSFSTPVIRKIEIPHIAVVQKKLCKVADLTNRQR
jgi:hypothetical protein